MKSNIFKIFTVFTFGIIFLAWSCVFTDTEEPKTAADIQKEKQESAASAREKQIDLALTQLKEMIKKQMKDPSSFEMLARTYDKKDTGDSVKLVIKYTGKNSFGANVTNVTFGTADLKNNTVIITETRQE